MEHSTGRVSAYVRHLRRSRASEALIADFLELVKIDNQIASEPDKGLESLDRLLLDSCRKFNFAAPFDTESRKAYLRPAQISSEHPDHRDDIWGSGSEFSVNEEQAYRRGFHQGFAEAVQLSQSDRKKSLARRAAEVARWRHSRVWYGATKPGAVEPFGLSVSVRSSIPPKLRWEILKRDNYRCVTCGAGAADGIVLHVDHVVSLYNGGTNDVYNLQTLCAPCNLGKGKE